MSHKSFNIERVSNFIFYSYVFVHWKIQQNKYMYIIILCQSITLIHLINSRKYVLFHKQTRFHVFIMFPIHYSLTQTRLSFKNCSVTLFTCHKQIRIAITLENIFLSENTLSVHYWRHFYWEYIFISRIYRTSLPHFILSYLPSAPGGYLKEKTRNDEIY